jgi:hypothetical protein
MYLGSWAIDDILTFSVNTHSFSTGVATNADSVPTYRVYEDNTQTPLLTGSMSAFDPGNAVGQYVAQITLSAANGFEVGKTYTIRIAATVGGVTGACVRTFQVGAKVNTTLVAGTTQTARDIGNALPAAAPGANGGLPTTNGSKLLQTADLTAGQTISATVTDKTGFALTSAEHSLISSTDVPAALTAQGYTTARAGYLDTLNGLVAAIWNALTSGMATVGSVGKRIADYLDVAVSSRSTGTALDAAGVRSAVGLASANLDTQLAALPTTTVLNSRTLPSGSYALQSSLDAHLPMAVKRNQPLPAFTFVMLDSADHVTPKAGLTVTARRKLDTGAWALCTNSVTFDATAPVPTYMIDLAAADLNGAVVTLLFTASGADPLQITILTQA